MKDEKVSAINAKQIEVTFSQAVGTNAGDPDNYNVRELAGSADNDVKKVNFKDDHTVILTLENEYRVSTDVVVTVEGVFVGDSIKDKFPKFSDVITVHDTVAPTIESVTANVTSTGAAQEIYVTLSEPIKTGTFRVNGKTVSAAPVGDTPALRDAKYATVYAITSQNLDVDKTHELELINVEDYAENKVASLTESFTIEKDTTEATGNVKAVSDNKIQVSFDKEVVEGSLGGVSFLVYNGSAYVAVAPVGTPTSTNGKDWTFTLDTDASNFYDVNKNKQEVLVKAGTSVIDTAGNPIKAFEEKVTLTHDTTGPALEGVTFDKNSKGEVTKLYLAYDEALATDTDVLQTYIQADGSLDEDTAIDVDAAKVDDYFKLVNKKTNDDTITFEGIFGTPDSIKLASDGKTVVVDLDLANNASAKKVTEGNYGLTAVKGFVLDTAQDENASSKVTKDLNIAEESNVVTATVTTANAWTTTPGDDEAVAGDNKFTVKFNQPVTEASAKNPANYKFNNNALPEDTVIKVNPLADEVEFELPSGYIAVDEEDAKLTITNIKPKDSSATFESYLDTEVVLDNTAPEAKGEIVGSGEIYLTFSEAVDITAGDFANDTAKLFINGLELTGTTVAFDDGVLSSTPGNTDDAIKITVNTKTEDLSATTGFSYLYIDVDGDGNFDVDKDIVLSQVKGAAPADWATADADLNNSVIKSVEVKTQDGDNGTVDKSYLGTQGDNKLESSAIIKIK